MDDRTAKDVNKDPAEIREEMRDTRAAMTEKLELLEGQVTRRVEDLQSRVEATVDHVRDSVHDTVETIRRSVDWRHQMNEHPWAMFGGAVMAGFVVTRLAGSSRVRSAVRDGVSAVSQGISHLGPVSTNPPAYGRASTLLDQVSSQFNSQVARLENAAVSAAGDFVERLIVNAVPGLAPHLHRFGGTRV
jgi:ElaB/YqjD/DUF883 family membrane-anchored ribosome-binding protein